MAQGNDDGVKKSKKKVAKTLLFDSDDALEKVKQHVEAVAQIQTAELEKQKEKEKEAAKAEAEAMVKAFVEKSTDAVPESPGTEPSAENGRTPVAKTLLFDPGKAVAAALEKQNTENQTSVKPARRVPKTMLFNPQSDALKAAAAGQEAGEARGEQGQTVRRLSTKKIAKTLIFDREPLALDEFLTELSAGSSVESVGSVDPVAEYSNVRLPEQATDQSQPLAEAPVEQPAPRSVRKMRGEQYVAKTMLDHSILFDQVSKSQLKAEEKAIEIARERANEPYVPFVPVEYKKKAVPCQWTWDATYATERYKYCGMCQKPVYNLEGLQQADADALILKVENTTKYTLFKRTDGLYMTGNCAAGVKRRSDAILLSTVGVIAIAALLIFMANLPKPKAAPVPIEAEKPDLTPAGKTLTADEVIARAHAKKCTLAPATGAKMAPGSGHYDAAQDKFVYDVPPEAPKQAPIANTGGPNQVTEQDWEFNTPQR